MRHVQYRVVHKQRLPREPRASARARHLYCKVVEFPPVSTLHYIRSVTDGNHRAPTAQRSEGRRHSTDLCGRQAWADAARHRSVSSSSSSSSSSVSSSSPSLSSPKPRTHECTSDNDSWLAPTDASIHRITLPTFEWFVKEQDSRVLECRASGADQQPEASGQRAGVGPDDGTIPIGQRHDRVVKADEDRGLLHLFRIQG
jgi:hypothetical protein